jgi:hypothetical protein
MRKRTALMQKMKNTALQYVDREVGKGPKIYFTRNRAAFEKAMGQPITPASTVPRRRGLARILANLFSREKKESGVAFHIMNGKKQIVLVERAKVEDCIHEAAAARYCQMRLKQGKKPHVLIAEIISSFSELEWLKEHNPEEFDQTLQMFRTDLENFHNDVNQKHVSNTIASAHGRGIAAWIFLNYPKDTQASKRRQLRSSLMKQEIENTYQLNEWVMRNLRHG